MSGIEYEYIGKSDFFIDRNVGTGQAWYGKGNLAPPNKATLDDLRSIGNIVAIDPAFVARFEELNVDCSMPQFSRVTPNVAAAKSIPDVEAIPVKSQYSGYSVKQLKALYTGKTGKLPTPKQTVAELVAEIERADVELLLAGSTVDDL